MNTAKKEEPTSNTCDLYLPGHQVHFIQARKALESAAAGERTQATLVVAADGVIVVSFTDGELVRYRTHSTRRIRRIAKPGDEVIVCERYRIPGVPGLRGPPDSSASHWTVTSCSRAAHLRSRRTPRRN